MRMHSWCRLLTAAFVTACFGAGAGADPVTIRVGYGAAAEEQLWLMKARPELMTHQNKDYKAEWTLFRGSEPRFKAFEVGQLDIASVSAPAALFAASQGVDFKLIASVCKESRKGYSAPYMVAESSPIHELKDLKGRTIGINGYKSAIELWARAAVRAGGLDPDRDVKWAVVPFPSAGTAVRTGLVDVAPFPPPFGPAELKRGGLRVLFTPKSVLPEDEEVMMLMAQPAYLKAHGDAVRAFLADFAAATSWYLQHPQEARQALIQSQMVMLKPEDYLDMPDYYRDPSGKPSLADLARTQDLLVQYGFQEKKVEVNALVDLSFYPQ
jgi:ABC-type nitrate/sulfonate/bicarbonate transport system substrate-binding protein